MDAAESNLRAAERVASLLVENGVPAVVIGGVALAAHRYVRHTEDIDLGVDADVPKMQALAAILRGEGNSLSSCSAAILRRTSMQSATPVAATASVV